MQPEKKKRVVRLIGVAFDAEDGHVRITRGEHFDLFMGSEGCHEFMRGQMLRLEEKIRNRGCSLSDLTPDEVMDLFQSE